jgi:hypothetical protein
VLAARQVTVVVGIPAGELWWPLMPLAGLAQRITVMCVERAGLFVTGVPARKTSFVPG